jgi:lipoyl(octanoyl) transferase
VTPLSWLWLGRRPYVPVWELMEEVRRQVHAEGAGAERLLFVEHEPVITLGRSADERNVLAPDGVEVVRTSRGGDVTWHGPGQLVIYPVVRLLHGVVRHLEAVAGAIVDELAALGVKGAAWRRDPAGVWLGEAKIAACGVHVARRVAIHGFALNVAPESLGGFTRIVPCGLSAAKTTCVAAHVEPPALADLASRLAPRIAERLDRSPVCACDPRLAR